MEKPLTEAVSMTFIGPTAMLERAVEIMRSLGFQKAETESCDSEVTGSIPWRESSHYKELLRNPPAIFLAGARYREGLTQMELAERSGIARRHISEMENAKRPIGKQNARKLAEVLNIDPRRLLAV